jgi:adenylate kinase family enzyme
MKIFILGLSNSGRTTVSQALVEDNSLYISAMDWIKSTFRTKQFGEDSLDFERSFNEYLSERIKVNPFLIADNIEEIIKSCPHNKFIIDGVLNPQNFMKLFDHNNDMLIVLNRIDNLVDSTDQDNIALNVIRDYCYWLSSMNLLSKDRWIEYNFRINVKGDGAVKKMGTRNIVYIVKSIDNVITHVKDVVKSIL